MSSPLPPRVSSPAATAAAVSFGPPPGQPPLPLRVGTLRKKGTINGAWRKRSVRLTPADLLFYSPGDFSAPTDSIRLDYSLAVSAPSPETVRGTRGFSHLWYSFAIRIKDTEHWLAAATEAEALEWKRDIESASERLTKPESSSPVSPGREVRLTKSSKQLSLRENLKRSASLVGKFNLAKVDKTIKLISKAEWVEALITNGIRIMAEVGVTKAWPVVKVLAVMPASPRRLFRMLTDLELQKSWDGFTECTRVLEMSDDDHFRRLHVKVNCMRIRGLPVSRRDFVVDVSWRSEDDGSFIIIEQTPANDLSMAPAEPGYCRARVFALAYTITPKRTSIGSDDVDADVEECLLQVAMHADCGGWLARMPNSVAQEWMYPFLLRVIGLREALLMEEFRVFDFASLQEQQPDKAKRLNAAPRVTTALSEGDEEIQGSLPASHWRNAEQPFKVRGENYLTDKKKIDSVEPKFDLIALDLISVEHPVEHIAQVKGSVAQRLVARRGSPFLFIVNFSVPDTKPLCFVAVFQAKPGVLDGKTPFSTLFNDFVDGDDQYRDSRFKLIPRVVRGPYIVKSAVGSTPCILGTKLVQSYHRGDNYMEVDVDVGSSSVAGGVLKVVKGYVTSLCIDLAFLLEPHSASELPECILSAMEFENLDLNMAVPFTPSSLE